MSFYKYVVMYILIPFLCYGLVSVCCLFKTWVIWPHTCSDKNKRVRKGGEEKIVIKETF